MPRNEALVRSFNQALEHAAIVQYLSHAQMMCGRDSEPMVARVRKIAGDWPGHAETCREIIGSYPGGVPGTGIAETHPSKEMQKLLENSVGHIILDEEKHFFRLKLLLGL